MKVVILAGGLGTRLMEETTVRPKPMVEIGGRPILWHIMQLYARQGFDDFIVALGYKGEVVKEYFLDHRLRTSDLHLGGVEWSACPDATDGCGPDLHVDLCDTGHETMTGGRLLRLAPRLRDAGTFMLTYGDGLADVDLRALLDFHRGHGRLATVTAVHPPAQRTLATGPDQRVVGFEDLSHVWVSGGFFVFEPAVLDYISGDASILEAEALARLADAGELMAYRHPGFWQCMDTTQERDYLEALWRDGRAPWARKNSSTPATNRSRRRYVSHKAPLTLVAGR